MATGENSSGRIWSFLLARRCTGKGPGGIAPLAFSTDFSVAPQPHKLPSLVLLGPVVGGHGHHLLLLGVLVSTVLQVGQDHQFSFNVLTA